MMQFFCAPCSIFSKAKGAFIREPCCDWSNFEKQAQRHIETKNHLDAMEAAKIFLKICSGEKKISKAAFVSSLWNESK